MARVSPTARDVEQELRRRADPVKRDFYPKFFRALPGQYAEGDQFLGVIVPEQRKVARQFRQLSTEAIEDLIVSPWHECRLTGLLVLVDQFDRATREAERKSIYDFYLAHLDHVNHWDLVDATAHRIPGKWLETRSRRPLYRLAAADHLWRNRVAMVATLAFIRNGDLDDALAIAEILLPHPHDLIHKATGWMLRECGKQDPDRLLRFLDAHGAAMSRTTLRYAIEKFPPALRQTLLEATRRPGAS